MANDAHQKSTSLSMQCDITAGKMRAVAILTN